MIRGYSSDDPYFLCTQDFIDGILPINDRSPHWNQIKIGAGIFLFVEA